MPLARRSRGASPVEPASIVAVVDTGIAPAPDRGRFLEGWNVVEASSDAVDDNGHGTHVAGTIGETADNGWPRSASRRRSRCSP